MKAAKETNLKNIKEVENQCKQFEQKCSVLEQKFQSAVEEHQKEIGNKGDKIKELESKKEELTSAMLSLKQDKSQLQALLEAKEEEEAKEEKENKEEENKVVFERYGNEVFYKLLESVKLCKYWALFVSSECCDLEDIACFDAQLLEKDIGIANTVHRRKLLRQFAQFANEKVEFMSLLRIQYGMASVTLKKLTESGLWTMNALCSEVWDKQSLLRKVSEKVNRHKKKENEKLSQKEIELIWKVCQKYLGVVENPAPKNNNNNNNSRERKQQYLEEAAEEGNVDETKGNPQQKKPDFI